MDEEGVFVSHQEVVAAVEGVFEGRGGIAIEQVRESGVFKPIAMEPPFAAGIKEAVGGEDLEDFGPAGAFAAGAKEGLPGGIELEFLCCRCVLRNIQHSNMCRFQGKQHPESALEGRGRKWRAAIGEIRVFQR